MLSDTSTYCKLSKDPTIIFQQKLKHLVANGVSIGIVTQHLADRMVVEFPTIAIFHSLPKIHKGDFPPPFRPIVAGIGSLNEHLSACVDSLLQPLIICIPGYLQDTNQVFNMLHNKKLQSQALR